MIVVAEYTGSIVEAHGLSTVVGPCPIMPDRFALDTPMGTLHQVRPESFHVTAVRVGHETVVL